MFLLATEKEGVLLRVKRTQPATYVQLAEADGSRSCGEVGGRSHAIDEFPIRFTWPHQQAQAVAASLTSRRSCELFRAFFRAAGLTLRRALGFVCDASELGKDSDFSPFVEAPQAFRGFRLLEPDRDSNITPSH